MEGSHLMEQSLTLRQLKIVEVKCQIMEWRGSQCFEDIACLQHRSQEN
ncbi:hypothetical protein ACP70R_042295 [Stipagrostis hirtigluma subsp. patula]